MTHEFHLPVRVYYEDTDAGGMVYHANYLRFMERARTEWLRGLGHEQDALRQQGVLFIVHSVAIEFVRPARFNEMLDVSVRVEAVRGASVKVQQTILNPSDEIVCEATLRIACVDADTFRPRPIPETLLPELAYGG